MSNDNINHPSHYTDCENNFNGLETIETIELLGYGFAYCLGAAIKYLDRCGKKNGAPATEDMEKAFWYVTRALSNKARDMRHGEQTALINCLNALSEFNIRKAREYMQGFINIRSGK